VSPHPLEDKLNRNWVKASNELTTLRAACQMALDASTKFRDNYYRLVNSGDCGNWDPRDEEVSIELEKAIIKLLEVLK